MIERELERKLLREVKAAGGVIYKLDSRAHKGAPDRVVLIDGQVWFVELKTETGRLSPIQQIELNRIQAARGKTRVLYGVNDVEVFIEAA